MTEVKPDHIAMNQTLQTESRRHVAGVAEGKVHHLLVYPLVRVVVGVLPRHRHVPQVQKHDPVVQASELWPQQLDIDGHGHITAVDRVPALRSKA